MTAGKLLTIDGFPDRRVAVAVELWDPIGSRPVWRRIEPRLKGRDQKPIVNRSGRFVWMGEPDKWPDAISVDMRGEPFESLEDLSLVARKPTGWPKVPPAKRLIRLPLTPTASYPFSGEIAGVRGDLYELEPDDPKKRNPVTDATVWLEWFDKVQGFRGGEQATRVTSADRGHFAAFVRVPHGANIEPDVENGLLLVQLVFVRELGAKIERTTSREQQFLPEPAPPGRIAESGAMEKWTSVNWKELKPRAD